MIIPNIWKKHVPNHQPVIILWELDHPLTSFEWTNYRISMVNFPMSSELCTKKASWSTRSGIPKLWSLPSGKRANITMENHHFYWVNQRTKWQFSIANCNKLPEGNFCQLRLGNLPSGKQTVCYWRWPIEIVDFPIKIDIFQSFLYVYQRVSGL